MVKKRRRFKLIKKYEGSPKVGYSIIFNPKVKYQFNHEGSFDLNECTRYKEYWEEVPVDHDVLESVEGKILHIKRLSDSEDFKIGDKIEPVYDIAPVEIKRFYYDKGMHLVIDTTDGRYTLAGCKKARPVNFITEVEKFLKEQVTLLEDNKESKESKNFTDNPPFSMDLIEKVLNELEVIQEFKEAFIKKLNNTPRC